VVPSEQRATVVSFDSMITGGVSVGGQVGLGNIAQRDGFSAGYVVCGVITLTAIPFFALVRKEGGDADLFAGANPEFAVATPAVPPISQVDGEVSIDRDAASTG